MKPRTPAGAPAIRQDESPQVAKARSSRGGRARMRAIKAARAQARINANQEKPR